jgi:hypothetical protein
MTAPRLPTKTLIPTISTTLVVGNSKQADGASGDPYNVPPGISATPLPTVTPAASPQPFTLIKTAVNTGSVTDVAVSDDGRYAALSISWIGN